MSKSRSLKARIRGPARGAHGERRALPRQRTLRLESLETRALLTGYTYPYGAMPDDTGEYMLGEVAVNVVLMESDPTMAPYDNNPTNDPLHPGHGLAAEDWTASTISTIKDNVNTGLQWWKDTLVNMFPNAPANLLNFHINWKYADNPVHTGYEPIARISNDFNGDSLSASGGRGWIYDFLHQVGFDATGSFSTDIRAFNDYTRQQVNPDGTQNDWAFTIFVVNNANDFDTIATNSVTTATNATQFRGGSSLSSTDGFYNGQNVDFTSGPLSGQRGQVVNYIGATRTFMFADNTFTTAPGVGNTFKVGDGQFAAGGSFTQAFSFAGGRFEVVPSSRPIKTYSHETGHQFWALDEYVASSSYTVRRGYYDTQNLNAADNPAFAAGSGVVQADSIMSNRTQMENSYANHTLDPYTMAAIGWQDSDHDGIFDVLDVPFTLSGYGQYNSYTGKYEFRGSTHVNALPNQNSSGTQDDIQINQINIIEASIDGGPWQALATYPARTYQASVSIDIPISGIHTINLRSADTRTGVTSNIFEGETDAPTQDFGAGVGGVVFIDANGDGHLNTGEALEPDVGLEVTDEGNAPLDLVHTVEPSDYFEGQVLDNVEPGAILSAVGDGIGSNPGDVFAGTIAGAGKVFTAKDILGYNLPWNDAQQLRVDFTSPVSTVSLRAYGSAGAAASFGRLDAYSSDGTIVARFSTGALSSGGFTTMTVSRAQGDIDHVVAYGRSGTSVVLDTLHWGPASSATTNDQGAYSLDYLPDGTYHVHLSPPAGYHVTTPLAGYATIAVSGGQTSGSVNFGIAPDSVPFHPFHNSANPYNVNNDAENTVAPIDALMVINYLNAHLGEGEISTGQDPNDVGYIDVVPDGVCAPNDALEVINWINSHPGGEGEATPAAPFSGGSPAGSGEGEGALQVPVPKNAADYYAQNPIHLLNIRGTDQPCTCAACMAARDVALSQVTQPPAMSAPASTALGNSDLLSEFASARAKSTPRLSSSPLLAISSPPSQQRASLALASRKQPSDSLHYAKPKLEEALDDIAADVSQAESWPGAGPN